METSFGGLINPAAAGTGVLRLVDDRAVVAAMAEAEVALARAQADLGVVPAAAAEAIAAAADPDALDLDALEAGTRSTANPVVGFVGALTAQVEARDPAAADHVHRGSTSQDILDTALMLVARRVLAQVSDELDRAATALAGLAAAHRDTPAAARTLTQQAVPTTFGLRAAGWRSGVLGARERIVRVRDELPVSLGGAAGTLASYAEYSRLAGSSDPGRDALELADRFAAHTGLARQPFPWHGVRLPIADLAGVLATTAGVLGKMAADVLVLTRTEVGEVSEGAAPGRGASSAMPQKQNPVYSTLVATAARQVPPLALVLMQSMVAEDERSSGAWHAEWTALRDALALTAGAAVNAAELAEGLVVRPDAMAANLRLTGGALTSERIGAVLADAVGKRAAKTLLTEATRAAGPDDLGERIAERLAAGGYDVPEGLAELLAPERYTGAAGALVDRELVDPG